jgi:ribosomal protein L11 methyltransferase
VSDEGFVTLRIEAPGELEEELVGRVYALGGAGSWSEPSARAPGRVRIHAYFETANRPDASALAALAVSGVTLGALATVEAHDWGATWRLGARPIEVGRRLLVDPREPAEIEDAVDPRGRFLLRLPARTAFGLGSHESTRLAVELLESVELRGRRVLDVGTGSGILAFAAHALGAGEVVALDLDPAAALLLPRYQELNAIRFPAFVGTLAGLALGEPPAPSAARGRFDLALVNVVPGEIAGDLPALRQALRSGALALFSGVLASELDAAIAVVERHGFRGVPALRRAEGEWVAFAAEAAS